MTRIGQNDSNSSKKGPRPTISGAIYRLLLERGEVSPFEVYEYMGRSVNYLSVTRMFHVLRSIGLIRVSRREKNLKSSNIYVTYYEMVPGKENDGCWFRPWYCYWAKKDKREFIPQTDRIIEELGGEE